MLGSNRINGERDDCKRFHLLLKKYCEERLCPALPHIYSYIVRDEEPPVLIDYPFDISSKEARLQIYSYNNSDMKLERIVCKCAVAADNRVFYALNQTFQHFSSLSTLKLDYCHLSSDHLQILRDHLGITRTISELSLTGNPGNNQNFYRLVNCGLKSLVLKRCQINEKGLRKMAKEFLKTMPQTSTLIHLDLSFNAVFDAGCKYVAAILKCNLYQLARLLHCCLVYKIVFAFRTLRSLNLTDCKIRDEGFKTLLASFVPFALNEEELLQRRKIRFEYFRKLHGAQDDMALIEETMKMHPFIIDSYQAGEEVFCKGNSCLESLNLAYNRLSRASLDLLFKVLMENGGGEKGLQRMVLVGNTTEGEEVMEAIEELLKIKAGGGLNKEDSTIKSSRSSLKKRKSSASN